MRTIREISIFVQFGISFVNVLKAALSGLFQNLQRYFSNISGFAIAMKVILCV